MSDFTRVEEHAAECLEAMLDRQVRRAHWDGSDLVVTYADGAVTRYKGDDIDQVRTNLNVAAAISFEQLKLLAF